MPAAGIFVVDCSVSIAWLFDQQADTYTEAALDPLVGRFAVAPRWWHVEVHNVLLALERRDRLGTGKAVELLRLMSELHALALRHQLTAYDALYLETALSTGLPLTTRDKGAAACRGRMWGRHGLSEYAG